jgi:hypothetical protein
MFDLPPNIVITISHAGGRKIPEVLDGKTGEKEIVYPRRTRFKVASVEKTADEDKVRRRPATYHVRLTKG